MRTLGAALWALRGLQRAAGTEVAQATLTDIQQGLARSIHAAAGSASSRVVANQIATCAALQQVQARSISGSAAPRAAVAIDGDAEGVLREVDRIVSSDSVGAKEVSDAAVALAYLQAKGNRRLWGKVFEKASKVHASFDAASLTSFLWAATSAGVGHFRTIFELSGAAARVLPSLNPAQLAVVAEGLGRAGTKDVELFARIGDQVTGNVGASKAGDLARVLWGFAAAGVEDGKTIKAVSQALAGKAGSLSGREAAQAVWALARLRQDDRATLDALVKAASGKLESPVDAAGLAWSLGYIGYKADAATAKALASVLKAGASSLTPAHAVDAAWGLGVAGAGDKDTVGALFSAVSSALDASPDALDPYQLASLFEAAALTPDAKISEQTLSFAGKLHSVVEEGARAKRSAGLSAFKEQLATAAARANGARYRPEIAAAVKSFSTTTPDGIHIDIAVNVDPQTRIAIEAVGHHYLSASGNPLGPALSRARLLESRGYKPVLVTAAEWAGVSAQAGGADPVKAQAAALLAKVKKAVPNAKVSGLEQKLNEPFDPYA